MKSERIFWVLALGAAGLLVGDALFTAVSSIIWPATMPTWQPRAWAIIWLVSMVLALGALISFVLRKRGQRDD